MGRPPGLAWLAARIGPVRGWVALLVLWGSLSSARPAPEPRVQAAPLRVVTYNIRHGRGMDGVIDLERTAAVLRGLDAEIIALQEVDQRVERSGSVAQADSLGALLGMQAAFGAFMPYEGGEYGIAILSRRPILRTESMRLPDGNEPRVALFVEIERDGQRLLVVTVHFDWVDDDGFRFSQADALAERLTRETLPVVLLGDFNDLRGTRTLARFAAGFRNADKPESDRFTFASDRPTKEIDFVMVGPRGRWSAADGMVVPESMASDHRPVVAVLSMRP